MSEKEKEQLKEEQQQEQAQENQENKQNEETKEPNYEEEYNKLKNEYLRLLADFDNYRKRMIKEIEDAKESAKRAIINDFLTILDNLEKAIEMAYQHKDAIIEGIELSIKSFKDMLKKHGVEEIKPDKETFDPNLHDALMIQESEELPKDTVIQTVQKGYIYKDKLIRPAKVIVSAGKKEEKNNTNNKKEE
ncbi:nucleotide exchange factor GrpE [Hippea alviniae]|uniref:nucleotide exchange factor GrpE n=1 Tax=Hippea alviniae TaxID=1279027 RepID=UPI0003B4ADE6|nr:nucleotide exchange factor GrpE [Hippea alviniae]